MSSLSLTENVLSAKTNGTDSSSSAEVNQDDPTEKRFELLHTYMCALEELRHRKVCINAITYVLSNIVCSAGRLERVDCIAYMEFISPRIQLFHVLSV